MAKGIGAVGHAQYFLEIRPAIPMGIESKPPYEVPTMKSIRAIPWNGIKVASTFSGAGGSCTGYRMAVCRVVWANEFVPIAQESYKANANSFCFLDRRDITTIQPEEILEACCLDAGELDIFDGSPPCQAFSSAGQRDKGWGKQKSYDHGVSQCNEQLFFDYIRLLNGLQPKTFVAENVAGLVRGVAKGFFLEILQALKDCGYQVEARILDAQWLGVPQQRSRVIFVGVRNDLKPLKPAFPKPFRYRYSVVDALPDIYSCTEMAGFNGHQELSAEKPSQTIIRSGATTCHARGAGGELIRRKFTIDEVKAICSFPTDFQLIGNYGEQWERLGNSVPPLMMRAVAETIRDSVLQQV